MRIRIRQALCMLIATMLPSLAFGQGVIVQSAGPVNRGMGGAAVAAPVDSIGAILWNPASISGMASSETSIGFGLLFPNHTVASSVGPASGSTEADAGAFPLPNIGWVHHTTNERVSIGFGMHTFSGFGTNLPVDPTNPVLAPAPTGLGQVSSNAMFLQLAPVLSYAVRDNFALAAGPTITTGRLTLQPFVFDSANPNGTYPYGNGTRYHWGGGFQLGAFYIWDCNWRFGASFKSPTWMETFEYNTTDNNGLPRTLTANFDLPSILSIGTSYQASESTLVALDVRYFDYANADGIGDPAVFDATGRLQGLGHGSVMSTALGIQQDLGDFLTVRCGYTFNQNPVKNSGAFFNIPSPVIYQHQVSGGFSINFSDSLSANAAYSYDFENTRTGPIVMPGVGPVPGSSVDNTLDAHFLSFGLTIRQ